MMPRVTPTSTSTPELLIQHAKNNDVDAVRELLLGEARSAAETDLVDKVGKVDKWDRDIGSYNQNNHTNGGYHHQRPHGNNQYPKNQFPNGSHQRTGVDDRRTGLHVRHGRQDLGDHRDDSPLPCRINVDGYDPHDQAQRTALYYAASRNFQPLCRLLLQCGANPNRPTATTNSTPLHAAADNGHVEIVQMLLERGARVSATGSNGDTALHLAASRGNEGVCRVLLQHGAPTLQENQNHRTPLTEAKIKVHHNIVRLLEEHERGTVSTPSGRVPMGQTTPSRHSNGQSRPHSGSVRAMDTIPQNERTTGVPTTKRMGYIQEEYVHDANYPPRTNPPCVQPARDPYTDKRMGRFFGGEKREAVRARVVDKHIHQSPCAISSNSGIENRDAYKPELWYQYNQQEPTGYSAIRDVNTYNGPRHSEFAAQVPKPTRMQTVRMAPQDIYSEGYTATALSREDVNVTVNSPAQRYTNCDSNIADINSSVSPPPTAQDGDDELSDPSSGDCADRKRLHRKNGTHETQGQFQASVGGKGEFKSRCSGSSDDEILRDARSRLSNGSKDMKPCNPPDYEPKRENTATPRPGSNGPKAPNQKSRNQEAMRTKTNEVPRITTTKGPLIKPNGDQYLPQTRPQNPDNFPTHRKPVQHPQGSSHKTDTQNAGIYNPIDNTLIASVLHTQGSEESRNDALFMKTPQPQGSDSPRYNALLTPVSQSQGSGKPNCSRNDLIPDASLNLTRECPNPNQTVVQGQNNPGQALNGSGKRCEHCCQFHCSAAQGNATSKGSSSVVFSGAMSSGSEPSVLRDQHQSQAQAQAQAQAFAQQFTPPAASGDTTHSNLYRSVLPIFKGTPSDFRQSMTHNLRESVTAAWPRVLGVPGPPQGHHQHPIQATKVWFAGQDFTVTETLHCSEGTFLVKINHENISYLMKIPMNPPPATPGALGLSCQARPMLAVNLSPSAYLHSLGISLAAPTVAEVFHDFPTSLRDLQDLMRGPGPTGGLGGVQGSFQGEVQGSYQESVQDSLEEKLVLQTVYQVLHVVLKHSNNSLTSKCIFYDGHFMVRTIFTHSQQISDWRPLQSVWTLLFQYGRHPEVTSSFSPGLASALQVLQRARDFETLRSCFIKIGILLFGPAMDEVQNDTDCDIWLQSKMMKLLVQPPSLPRLSNGQPAPLATALTHTHCVLEMDFVTTVTGQELFESLQNGQSYHS